MSEQAIEHNRAITHRPSRAIVRYADRFQGRSGRCPPISLSWNDFEQFAAKGDEVTDIVAKYGGRDIAYDNALVLEGVYQPESILIIEFPSVEQLLACYQSEEYAPYKALRQSCGRMNVLAVDGVHNEATANGPQSS